MACPGPPVGAQKRVEHWAWALPTFERPEEDR
jgi:hypothetical protein